MKRKLEINDPEFDELKTLCKKLLLFCDKLSEKPYYIVKPTVKIIRAHAAIINKLVLFDKEVEREL